MLATSARMSPCLARLMRPSSARGAMLPVVAQIHGDGALRAALVDGEPCDVAFLLQDLGDLGLDLRGRRDGLCLPRDDRVADPGQEISDWISHLLSSPTTSST